MRRLLGLLPLLAALLLGAGGVAAWIHGPRSYPGLVYYTGVSVSTASPYWSFGKFMEIREWIDPRHRRERIQIGGLPGQVERVLRSGQVFDSNAASRRLFAGAALDPWLDWAMGQGCAGIPAAPSVPVAGPVVRVDIGSGYVATMRCTRYRIEPGTLPAGFFDPPRAGQSLWDRARDWLSAHI